MHALLNFEGEAHFMAYLTDPADITPYQYYSKQVLDYLNTNMPDWTLIGLYGHERIRPIKPTLNQDLRQFAASLPYKLVTRGYAADTIPESLRHKVTVELAPDALAGPDASITLALSELGNDRLTLSYVPSSGADDAVVNDYGSLYSAPAYLINVKPQLRQNGTVVATGAGMGLGEQQTVTITFHTPTLTGAPIVNQIKAGSYSALIMQGLSASGERPSLGMQELRIQAGLNEQGQSSLDATFGQLLQNIGLLWFWDIKYERDFYATTQHVAYTRLPSQAIVTADLSVHYFFGIPQSVERIFYNMDVDMDVVAAAAQNGDNTRRKSFAQLAGLTGSFWEGGELEGVFKGPDISSVSIIKQATRQNIPIHTIDQSNLGQVLPLLALAPEDITDIRNAVNAGRQVIAPQSEVQIASWKGVGMIALDPANGQGLYLVSGGLAGGSACRKDGEDIFTPCKIDEWEKLVSNNLQVSIIARAMIVKWAASLWGTPYGFGCKDPDSPNDWCVENRPTNEWFGIDCSGLIARAYLRVGFDYFGTPNKPRNVEQQKAVVDAVGYAPDENSVKMGDLIFFDNTYDRLNSDNGKGIDGCCDDPLTHVGIVLNPDPNSIRWIAAQSGGVGQYTYGNCPQVSLYEEKTCIASYDFNSYGSVINR